jgi:acyl-coenzyme A thioesterase PaaI-like protein
VHVGKSLATAEAKLYGRDDGKLYAHGSTTCFVFVLQPGRQ